MLGHTQNNPRKSSLKEASASPSITQEMASIFLPALHEPDTHRVLLELLAQQSPALRIAVLDIFIRSVVGNTVSSPGLIEENPDYTARHAPSLSRVEKEKVYDALLTQLESGPFQNDTLSTLHRALTEEGSAVTLAQLRACKAHFTIALTAALKDAGLFDKVSIDQKREMIAPCYTAALALLVVSSQDRETKVQIVAPVTELLQCSPHEAITLVCGLLLSPPLRHRSGRKLQP